MDDEDLNNFQYPQTDPKEKRIKYYVFSSPRFYRKQFQKKMIEYPDTGIYEDVDVYDIKNKYIKPFLLENSMSDAEYNTNLTKEQFWNKIAEIDKDFKLHQFDCYFFMFFTYATDGEVRRGDKDVEEEMLHFRDGLISINDIWKKLTNIEVLRGKPKIFLIQSDNLKHSQPEQKIKAGMQNFDIVKIPLDADRLIIQSTLPAEFAQKRDEAEGKALPSASFLVQAFIEIMDENRNRPPSDRSDMLSLSTAINCRVRAMIDKFVKKDRYPNLPYPQASSTLTKLLYI